MSIGIKCAPGVVGPLEADIDFDIIKNDNDTFTVKYTPPGAGLYTIMVLFANQVGLGASGGGGMRGLGVQGADFGGPFAQATPTSPIRIKVDPSHDASKVKAEGPGLSRSGELEGVAGGAWGGPGRDLGTPPLTPRVLLTGVELGKPTHFTVNAKAGGRAPLDVQVTGPGKGEAVRDMEVIDNHDGTHTVKYTPLQQVTGGRPQTQYPPSPAGSGGGSPQKPSTPSSRCNAGN